MSLTLTASRLLCYFVQHEGTIITREELLANVWEAYGVGASGNSLNQHLSILRKKLFELGITEEVIKTIPKVGFKANHVKHIAGFVPELRESIEESLSTSPALKHETEADSDSDSDTDSDSNLAETKAATFFSTQFFHKCIGRNLWVHVVGLSAILSMGGMIKIQHNKIVTEYANFHQMGSIGECPVYSIYVNNSLIKEKKMEIIKKRIEMYNIPCISPSDFYIVNISDNLAFGKHGVSFISYCTSNKNDLVDSCRDYYEPF